MAARRGRKPGFIMTDEHRLKIQKSNILNCLIEHVTEGREMSATQVTAGVALLRKVLPDLTSTELKAEVELTNDAAVPRPQTYEDWLKYVGSATRPSNGSDPNGKVH